MKLSSYNHFFEKGDYSYWYNCFTNTYFRLSAGTGRALKNAINSIEDIEKQTPALYHKLVSGGFIVDDDKDELSEIIQRAQDAMEDKNAFIIIIPTLNCNYSCWYCIQEHIPSLMSAETIEKVKRHIDYLIKEEEITSLKIDWFGGEPLMFFNQVVKPISLYAKEACNKAGIFFHNGATTNAYYLKKEIFDDLKDISFRSFQITIDGNKSNHDNVKKMKGLESSFNHALTAINDLLLSSDEIYINLRINYTHENLSKSIVTEICSLIDPTVRSKILINPKKVWQEKVDKTYESKLHEIINEFQNNGFKVTFWEPITNGVPCYVSKRLHKTINYDGSVLKCTANDDLYAKSPKGIINDDGSITWNEEYYRNYSSFTFDNEECLKCKFLPVCYGQCPRNWIKNKNVCKMDSFDQTFESSLIAFIDQQYNINP